MCKSSGKSREVYGGGGGVDKSLILPLINMLAIYQQDRQDAWSFVSVSCFVTRLKVLSKKRL